MTVNPRLYRARAIKVQPYTAVPVQGLTWSPTAKPAIVMESSFVIDVEIAFHNVNFDMIGPVTIQLAMDMPVLPS